MKQILVYGDSLSWGIIPGTRERHPHNRRWPGVLEQGLQARGQSVRVIEDCLNGRRTVWDDPFKAGRKGLDGFAQRMEVNAPLALLIFMLGSNDFQSMHPHNAWHSSQGMASLVLAARGAPIEPGMPVAPILIVAPPPIQPPRGAIAPKFAGGEHKCVGLAAALQEVAATMGCAYFDAGGVIATSPVDGVHLDAEQHLTLGRALVAPVAALLGQD